MKIHISRGKLLSINKELKEVILSEINNHKTSILIPDFVPQDQELKNAYQTCIILDKYLSQYFIKNNTKYNQTQVNQKLDDILKKFKQEVLSALLQEKDRFRNEVKNKNKALKIFLNLLGVKT